MNFNPSKCQVFHISRSKNPIKHPYILHGQVLKEIDHAKYLGLDISRDLSWNNHIQKGSVMANRALGFIRRNIRTKHKGIRETAYNILVRPQVEYAFPIWGPYTQANINKVEKVQSRAARWVSNDYSSYSSVTQMLNILGWRSLEQRRSDACLILLYKIVYGLVEIPVPAYNRHPVKMTQNMHSMHYIQIPTTASYYRYSFFP